MTKHNISLENKFLLYVQKSDDPNMCWEWIGGKNPSGYGRFRIGNKMYQAHRISYALFVGDIPDNLFICHSCDNPGCINPNHLFLGTPQDNMDDMIKKNRDTKAKGEQNGQAKLTETQVYQIREKLEQGYTQQEIADMFGMSRPAISFIKLNKRWKWLK